MLKLSGTIEVDVDIDFGLSLTETCNQYTLKKRPEGEIRILIAVPDTADIKEAVDTVRLALMKAGVQL